MSAMDEAAFGAVADEVLNDRRIPWDALGLLCYILNPESPRLRAEDLMRAGKGNGREAVRRMMGDLEDLGYLEQRRVPFKGTTLVVHYPPVEQPDSALRTRQGKARRAARRATEALAATANRQPQETGA